MEGSSCLNGIRRGYDDQVEGLTFGHFCAMNAFRCFREPAHLDAFFFQLLHLGCPQALFLELCRYECSCPNGKINHLFSVRLRSTLFFSTTWKCKNVAEILALVILMIIWTPTLHLIGDEESEEFVLVTIFLSFNMYIKWKSNICIRFRFNGVNVYIYIFIYIYIYISSEASREKNYIRIQII